MGHDAVGAPPEIEAPPALEEPPPVIPEPIADEIKTFQVQRRESTLTAAMDAVGDTKILDYPTEWRGQAKLIRYDGGAASPFSEEHCEEIRKLAEGGGGILIRNSHHSLAEFSMPFFLTCEFGSTVAEAAEAAGLPTNLYVTNPPQVAANGTLELRFKDDAISPKSGSVEYLFEQLHFRYKGIDEGDRRILTVFSGDILCDLAEGDVEMIMTYPIQDEEQVIKIIYDHLQVDGLK